MWEKQLTKYEKEKVETVLREARRAKVNIGDRRIVKKDGKLHLLWSETEIHDFEIGKYA